MNVLDRIPPDKARHAIGGALICLVSMGVANAAHAVVSPVLIGMVVATLAAAVKEAADHIDNVDAIDVGLPPPHEVSRWDFIATVLGACVPALAATLGGV